jgi:hypothetical protein
MPSRSATACDRVRRVELLGDPARRQLHHRAVKAAHDPGPVVGDVDVALGQQAQHLDVISRANLPQRGRAKRSDRYRQGVVRIVLVRATGAQHPDP